MEKLNAIDRDLKVLNDKENESKMLIDKMNILEKNVEKFISDKDIIINSLVEKFRFWRRNVIQRCLNMIKRWIFSLQNYVWCQVMKKGLLG